MADGPALYSARALDNLRNAGSRACGCQTVAMTVPFAPSARSTVGIEWELMLADRESGDLVPRAPDILAPLQESTKLERFTVTQELLTNTIEQIGRAHV